MTLISFFRFSPFIVLFAHTFSLKSQTWQWGRNGVGTGSVGAQCFGIATDGQGNAYIAGNHGYQTLSFGTNTLVNNGTPNADIYLVKYSSSGAAIWARGFGSGDNDHGWGICTFSNSLYLCGNYGSSNIGFGSTTLTSTGLSPVYIAKLDLNGSVLWARGSDPNSYGGAVSVSADPLGNTFLTGSFESQTISFGTSTLNLAGGSDCFLVKYDPNGNVLWAKQFGGNLNEGGSSVSADPNGNVYLTGAYRSSSVVFGSYTVSNTGTGQNIFLAKFDANGNVLWVKNSVGTEYDAGYSVSADPFGNVFLAGTIDSPTISFGTTTVSITGNYNSFLSRYAANGSLLWIKASSGSNEEAASVVSNSNSVFYSGTMGSSMTIGNYTINNPGGPDPIFLAHLDLNGNVMSGMGLGYGGSDGPAMILALDQTCNLYAAGDFWGTNMIIGTNTLSQSGNKEVPFLAKLDYCVNVGLSELANSATSFLSPNPNSGSFSLRIEKELMNGQLEIYNSLYQKIYSCEIGSGSKSFSIDGITPGVYFCNIFERGRRLYVCKMLVN